MFTQALSLVSSMYDAIGPGFLLAVTFPFFLALLVLVLRASVKRAIESD